MSIRFSCAECGTQLKVPDEKAGGKGKCPACGAAIVVPAASVTEPPPETAAAEDPWLSDDPELFGEAAGETLPPPRVTRRRSSAGGAPSGYRPAPTLTTITTVLIGMIMLLDLGMLLVSIAQVAALNAPQLPAEDELQATDLAALGLFLIRFPTFIACTVCFLMWTYRANTNAAALSGRPLEITPGWSVGWYFVPFANLVKPYHAMKEIWVASARSDASTGLVSLWWTLWIVSNIANNAAFRYGLRADTVEELRVSLFMDIGVGILDVPLNIVAILLVRRLFALQESRTQGSASADY